jgi:hypothetical protein
MFYGPSQPAQFFVTRAKHMVQRAIQPRQCTRWTADIDTVESFFQWHDGSPRLFSQSLVEVKKQGLGVGEA